MRQSTALGSCRREDFRRLPFASRRYGYRCQMMSGIAPWIEDFLALQSAFRRRPAAWLDGSRVDRRPDCGAQFHSPLLFRRHLREDQACKIVPGVDPE